MSSVPSNDREATTTITATTIATTTITTDIVVAVVDG